MICSVFAFKEQYLATQCSTSLGYIQPESIYRIITMSLNEELLLVLLSHFIDEVSQAGLSPWVQVDFWLLNDDKGSLSCAEELKRCQIDNKKLALSGNVAGQRAQ